MATRPRGKGNPCLGGFVDDDNDLSSSTASSEVGHNEVGHNEVGHNEVGHNEVGHTEVGNSKRAPPKQPKASNITTPSAPSSVYTGLQHEAFRTQVQGTAGMPRLQIVTNRLHHMQREHSRDFRRLMLQRPPPRPRWAASSAYT